MAINFKTNIPAFNSGNNLTKATNALAENLQKLSSGKRLNSAKDGAAELAISTQLMSQMRALNQASRNTMDGVSMIQTAEGATSSMSDNLIRMRELAMQSANGTLSDDDRAAINSEYEELRAEIDRTAGASEFNGQKLLDGSANVNLQVGTGSGPESSTSINIDALDTANLGDGTTTVAATSVSSAAGALEALSSLDGAMNQISGVRSELGAKQNSLASTNRNLSVERENIAAANSRIADVDVAAEAVSRAQNEMLSQSAAAVHAQANQIPAMGLALIG